MACASRILDLSRIPALLAARRGCSHGLNKPTRRLTHGATLASGLRHRQRSLRVASTGARLKHYFKLLAASRIGDVARPPEGTRPIVLTPSVWVRSRELPVCAFRDRRACGQCGNSRRMTARTSASICGLPGHIGRGSRRQKGRNPARCQATTVSGLTMTRTLLHEGYSRRKRTRNIRSWSRSRGRGFFRLSAPSCCRRARISRPRLKRERKKTPGQLAMPMKKGIMGSDAYHGLILAFALTA
jgi:hypothetical protein